MSTAQVQELLIRPLWSNVLTIALPATYRVRGLLVCAVAAACLAGCGDGANTEPAEPEIQEVVRHESVVPETSVDSELSDSDHAASGKGPDEVDAVQMAGADSEGRASTEAAASEATADEPMQKEVPVQPAVRLSDDRPDVNELRLQQAGIRMIESRRLRLLTDLPAGSVDHYPAVADELFVQLEQHFGQLPPAADGSDFQVTGHLIGDEARFRSAGLMPESQFTFQHGRHLNYQFWLYQQNDDYYQRHLLLHEFTHCFMTCESGMQNIPPLWYIEGMAEYFATHVADGSSTGGVPLANPAWTFGVMPHNYDSFSGWGRIFEIQRILNTGASSDSNLLNAPGFSEVTADVVRGSVDDADYAWWWAVCWMLASHPDYSPHLNALSAYRRRVEFLNEWHLTGDRFGERLNVDWLLFLESLDEGFDPQHGFPVHSDVQTDRDDLTVDGGIRFTLDAGAGWQSTGLTLEAGDQIELTAEGRFQVADDPVPWIAEPQGITIEYYRGIPLGQLVAVIVSSDGAAVTGRIPVGRQARVEFPVDGTLWLQVNESAAGRRDNSGSAEVVIRSAAD
jgi:hypothetical protein